MGKWNKTLENDFFCFKVDLNMKKAYLNNHWDTQFEIVSYLIWEREWETEKIKDSNKFILIEKHICIV